MKWLVIALSSIIVVTLALGCERASRSRKRSKAEIDTEDKARLLADAIISDIALYNTDAIAQSTVSNVTQVLAGQIEEGRVLFRERVAPAFHRLYEEALSKLAIQAGYASPTRDWREAERLAQLIIADILQYHTGDEQNLRDEVAEGRELFRARVEPGLYSFYEHQAEKLLNVRRPAN